MAHQNDTTIRINKYLSECGVASRRGADELILQGRVQLNGVLVLEPGIRVNPVDDVVLVDGQAVRSPYPAAGARREVTVLLHKPVQVVTTARDPQGRTTVFDILPPGFKEHRLLHVGRLDYFSEGLLLLTTDGSLMNRLISPRWHLPKVYQVLVRGQVDEAWLEVMRKGMTLAEGEKLAPVEVRLLRQDQREAWLEMTLVQGLNRQIRRMCRDMGRTVLRLIRVRQGFLELGSLKPGEARELSAQEVQRLRQAVGLPPQ